MTLCNIKLGLTFQSLTIQKIGELVLTANSPKFGIIRMVKWCDYQKTLTLQI